MPADRQIVTTRVLDAPRERVFRAWTEPGHLSRWWGPKTRLTFEMLFETVAECEKAKTYAVETNEQNFDRLEAELARMA